MTGQAASLHHNEEVSQLCLSLGIGTGRAWRAIQSGSVMVENAVPCMHCLLLACCGEVLVLVVCWHV